MFFLILYVYEDFNLDLVRDVLVDKTIKVMPLSKRAIVPKMNVLLKNEDVELVITPEDVFDSLVTKYGEDNRFASWNGGEATLRDLLSGVLQLELVDTSVVEEVQQEEVPVQDEVIKASSVDVQPTVEVSVEQPVVQENKAEVDLGNSNLHDGLLSGDKLVKVVEVFDANNLLQGIDLSDSGDEEVEHVDSQVIEKQFDEVKQDCVVNCSVDDLRKIKDNFELQIKAKDQLYSKFVSPERYIEVKNNLQQALTTISKLRDDLVESQNNIVEVETRQLELQNKVDVLTADIEVYENVGGNFTAQDHLLQLDEDLIHNLKSKVTFHVLGDSLSFDYFYSKYNFENLFVEFTNEAYSDMYLDHYVNLKDTTDYLGGNVSLSSVISNAIYKQNTVYVVSGLASIVDYSKLTLGSLKYVLNSLVLSSYTRVDVYLGTLSSANKFIDMVLANNLDLKVWTSVNSSELSMRFALLNILGRLSNLESTKNITLVADSLDFINNEQFQKFKTQYLEGSVV